MLYIKLAMKEMKRHFAFNILIIILLAFVFGLCMTAVSLVRYRFKYYFPYQEELNSTGRYMTVDMGNITNENGESRLVRSKSELEDELSYVEKVEGMYQLSPTYLNYRRVYGWAYDTDLVEKYTPEMLSGRWFDVSDADSEDIVAVAAGDNEDVNPGDTVELKDDFNHTIKVKIIGLLSYDTKIFGLNPQRAGVCEDYFTTPGEINSSGIYGDNDYSEDKAGSYITFFYLNDQLDRSPFFSEDAGGDGTGVQRVMTGSQFIIYEDGTTEEQIKSNDSVFSQFTILQNIPLETMSKQSIKYVFAQLYIIMPIFICIFLLAVVALFSIEIFTANEQLHNYSIFYIQGMVWRKCIWIHFIHQIVINLLGVLLMGGIYYGVNSVVDLKEYNIGLSTWGLGLCLVMVILNLLIALIVPRSMLKKRTPVEILHTYLN